ncbi:MAG TPA: response regulator transcription factor [Pyrinomonadaceae bacterium]|nr:response regulator transcription factor [Pyrinomonadaceae bacterium]
MREIRVIIVDDHPVARQGLLAIFKTDASINVLGDAHNAQEGITRVMTTNPDIAIVDIEMSRDAKDGFVIARELRESGFTGAIIFLTHLDNKHCFEKFLRSGEKGYITKNDSPKAIIEGIKTVAAGNVFISAEMLKKVPVYYIPEGIDIDKVHLTPREIEVLDSLFEYLTSKEMGQRLGIEHRTVEKHLQNLHEKLNLHSKDALIAWWRKNRPL